MTLVKFHPKKDLLRDTFFQTGFNSLFDSFINEAAKTHGSGFFSPITDVSETESSFVIEVTLPGIKKEDIRVDLKNDILTISGERKLVKEEKEKKYHRMESAYGSFSRSFTLPENVSKDTLEASFTDGILHITLPKAADAAPKAIEIK